MQGKPTEHTPLPWELHKRDDHLFIAGPLGNSAVVSLFDLGEQSLGATQDAEFIIRAVNSHYSTATRLASYEAALREVPVVSQYHTANGFEVENFLIDYAAWKHNARKALEAK